MSYMITAECINCNACRLECPVRAITPGPSQFRIDAQECVECEGYFPVPRCKHVCPVAACVPARESYLTRARSLSQRGAPPWVIKPAAPQSAAKSEDTAALQQQLDLLQRKLALITHKETRAEIRYEIAQLQWRLGQISDEEFRQVEQFYEGFTYEWC